MALARFWHNMSSSRAVTLIIGTVLLLLMFKALMSFQDFSIMMIAVEFLVALLAGVTLAALYEFATYRRSENKIAPQQKAMTSNIKNLEKELIK